jgi:hypothetical protein
MPESFGQLHGNATHGSSRFNDRSEMSASCGLSHSACLRQIVGGRCSKVKSPYSHAQLALSEMRFMRPPSLGYTVRATSPGLSHLLDMNLQEFRNSLLRDGPPKELTLPLAALWWDAKGDWTKAHESAQQEEGPAGAWVHAHLHRKEGDLSNAGYWYQRARRPPASISLDKEWAEIARSLLSEG